MPIFFTDLRRPVEEINADILRGIELARRFLSECTGAPAPGIRAILGRLLMARHARHEDDLLRDGQARLGRTPTREQLQALRVEVSQEMSGYFAEVESLITVALEESPIPSPARETALKVSFDLDDRLGRHEALRATAARILAESPGSPYVSRVLVGVGDSYFKEGRYQESAAHFHQLLAKRAEDPEYITYAEHLFEALTGEGDLEGMEDLAHALREETVRRAGSVQGENQKRKLEEWRYNSSFWIGFARMARGDDRGAEEAFREHIAAVNGLEARLATEGKKLDNVLQIYRDFRSKDLLEFLEKYHGQVPEVDLDLRDYWASETKLNLQAARGKVVAVVFRMPRYRRASTFLQEVDRLVKEKGSEGLAGITLGYLTGVENPAEDAKLIASLQEDLRELGVSLPAGFDPDRKEKTIFRALNGTVGTPSFVILNRRGELSWFLEDPRDLHRGILRKVVERHLAEKP